MHSRSHPEVFCEKGVLRNFAKFTGKHLCQSLFLNKVVGLRPAALLKKRLWHKCFPANFAKYLRTPLLPKNHSRLLVERITVISNIFTKFWSTCAASPLLSRAIHNEFKLTLSFYLKVHLSTFENQSISSYSHENKMSKISP